MQHDDVEETEGLRKALTEVSVNDDENSTTEIKVGPNLLRLAMVVLQLRRQRRISLQKTLGHSSVEWWDPIEPRMFVTDVLEVVHRLACDRATSQTSFHRSRNFVLLVVITEEELLRIC